MDCAEFVKKRVAARTRVGLPKAWPSSPIQPMEMKIGSEIFQTNPGIGLAPAGFDDRIRPTRYDGSTPDYDSGPFVSSPLGHER